MLHTKIQPQSFLGPEKKILTVLPYMGYADTLLNGAKPFEQIVSTPLTEGPM